MSLLRSVPQCVRNCYGYEASEKCERERVNERDRDMVLKTVCESLFIKSSRSRAAMLWGNVFNVLTLHNIRRLTISNFSEYLYYFSFSLLFFFFIPFIHSSLFPCAIFILSLPLCRYLSLSLDFTFSPCVYLCFCVFVCVVCLYVALSFVALLLVTMFSSFSTVSAYHWHRQPSPRRQKKAFTENFCANPNNDIFLWNSLCRFLLLIPA